MVFTSLTKPLLSLFYTRPVVILQIYKNPFNVDSVLIIIIIVVSVNHTHPSHMIRPLP